MSPDASLDKKMIKALLKRKRHYEKFLNGLESVDNPAQSAYNSIIKTIIEISRKMEVPQEADNEESREKAMEIFEGDYGFKRE